MDDKKKLEVLLAAAKELAAAAKDAVPLINGTPRRPLGTALTNFNKVLKALKLEDS